MTSPAFPLSAAAAYRYTEIADPAALRQRLLVPAQQLGLKGTVLLAPEGIKLSLAADKPWLREWLAALAAEPGFADLHADRDVKWQSAARLPFSHLRVMAKREVIRMNQPAVMPAAGRVPAVDAPTLARWLEAGHCDAGRPLLLLDARIAFEGDAGAFERALDWPLSKFSDFPAALAAHADTLRGKTVISCCTGGIRCETAALWMQASGLPQVLQLEGGLLRYFEQVAGAPHWRGRCVVFDGRESLDTQLEGAAA